MGNQIIFTVLVFLLMIPAFGCSPKKTELLYAKGTVICTEAKSGRVWQAGRGGPFYSFQEAEEYAVNLQLGGYDDWRLPTKQELSYLHKVFFWKKNNGCELNQSGEYWSVSENGQPRLGHWETDYLCDPEFKYVDSVKPSGYVRAVRP